ncbi:alpha-galactosidase [Erythrobacter aquimaris]|uniref:alpha-galactosidase n=1 Tax=Qipengyuania aquimaris TaxID=255984 RepID=A0A6I4TFE4_9SPHN|nr:alpha-galactosidase [Qipengyuania aquimaris]MXO94822.1 alpha-galactosidase [Qipengyuania aquimaris]
MSEADLLELHGEEWSLVIERLPECGFAWRHLGERVEPGSLPAARDLLGATTFSIDDPQPLPVFPLHGSGWFGPSILSLLAKDARALDLEFTSFEATASGDRIELRCSDDREKLSCSLRFSKLASGLTVETAIRNEGREQVVVSSLASAFLPVFASADRIISWRGRHAAEFEECVDNLPANGWHRTTREGLTGHGGPAACQILAGECGWHSGLAFSAQLAWSGDSRLAIEKHDEGMWLLTAEASISDGEVRLEPGGSYHSPMLLVAISGAGRNGVAAQQHSMVRAIAEYPAGEMRPRPVHLNSWEACYFAHDEARIRALASAAAVIGVERFVLDDGWFKGRDNDRAGLGDWKPDPRKYPAGLAPIAEHVRSLGMEFGLWVEPEMVNPDSDLFRAHPDWALANRDTPGPTARSQLVLDMRQSAVRDYLFEELDSLLSSAPISYLKWDHNRAHAPSGGSAKVRGTYALLARIREAHPDVEIESCAAGGGRIDAGIARHVHRFWTSDNIDAIARIPMQRGFLAFFPPEMMGAHVGASPSHATGRSQSLGFRAAVACQGHFGIELDPAELDPSERDDLDQWVSFYKRWRGLAHGGETLLGEGPNGLTWQAQGNGREYIVWITRTGVSHQRRDAQLPLPFAAGQDWHVRLLDLVGGDHVLAARSGKAIDAMRETPLTFSGSWLAHAGLPLPALNAEGVAIFHLEAA